MASHQACRANAFAVSWTRAGQSPSKTRGTVRQAESEAVAYLNLDSHTSRTVIENEHQALCFQKPGFPRTWLTQSRSFRGSLELT
jgi:hypothetical protein